jgi:hypothetical protein
MMLTTGPCKKMQDFRRGHSPQDSAHRHSAAVNSSVALLAAVCIPETSKLTCAVPVRPSNDPVQRAREKMIAALVEQKQMADAKIAAKASPPRFGGKMRLASVMPSVVRPKPDRYQRSPSSS